MDARPVAILNRVNPSESIHPKTQTYLTPLESHSCNMTQYKIFRITFLRKNRGRGGHSVNQLPETGTSSMSFPRPTSRRGLFFPFNFNCRLSTSSGTFASSPSLSYTHSLSLQSRSCKC